MPMKGTLMFNLLRLKCLYIYIYIYEASEKVTALYLFLISLQVPFRGNRAMSSCRSIRHMSEYIQVHIT